MRKWGGGSLKNSISAARTLKGQVEFIILVGIVVVIAVVLLFALSTDTIFPTYVPASVAQEKKLVEDAVTNVGRQGADLSIKWIEQQGGFIETDINNVVAFTNVAVPYWQRCGLTAVPSLSEITERLQTGVRNYIANDLAGREAYFSKNVSFDLENMYVSANILKNKIDFSVYLPTTIREYAIPQPYTFSVPTKLGEIHDFGKSFVEENARNRYLEHFTINTIYFSDELETQGVLTECGQGIYQSGTQISKGLENVITYTLTNTVWWQPMPQVGGGSKVYAIESLNGRTYEQLEVGFYLPDEFELGQSAPLSITNSGFSAAGFIFRIPVCFAPYDWKYSVEYPVIVRVRDDLTGHYMNFAVYVGVDEMEPGSCSGYLPTGDDIETGCYARIRAVERDGSPIDGAMASFADQFIGVSGEDGIIEGPTVCGTGDLILNKADYGIYVMERTQQEFTGNLNGTYELYKKPTIELNFRQVDMTSRYRTLFSGYGLETEIHLYDVCDVSKTLNQIIANFSSRGGEYGVTNIDPDSNVVECFQSAECTACIGGSQSMCSECISNCPVDVFPSVTIDYLPADGYKVITDMWNFQELKATGGFVTSYSIPERDETYYMYVPVKVMLITSDAERRSLTRELKTKCNMNPISTREYTGVVNMVIDCSCGELANMVRTDFSSCISDSEYNELFSGGCSVNGVKNALLNECGYEVYGCG